MLPSSTADRRARSICHAHIHRDAVGGHAACGGGCWRDPFLQRLGEDRTRQLMPGLGRGEWFCANRGADEFDRLAIWKNDGTRTAAQSKKHKYSSHERNSERDKG